MDYNWFVQVSYHDPVLNGVDFLASIGVQLVIQTTTDNEVFRSKNRRQHFISNSNIIVGFIPPLSRKYPMIEMCIQNCMIKFQLDYHYHTGFLAIRPDIPNVSDVTSPPRSLKSPTTRLFKYLPRITTKQLNCSAPLMSSCDAWCRAAQWKPCGGFINLLLYIS